MAVETPCKASHIQAVSLALQMSDFSSGDRIRQVEDTTAFSTPQAEQRITAAAAEPVSASSPNSSVRESAGSTDVAAGWHSQLTKLCIVYVGCLDQNCL